MDAKYLCESWQGLLQQVVYLVSKGYYHYSITYLPSEKKEKWLQIDGKMIEKYKTNKSKWTRSRNKKKGLRSYFYLRQENIMIVMHTPGEIEPGVVHDDQFQDIHQKHLILKISDLVSFSVQFFNNERLTVRFDKQTYEGFRMHFHELAKTKNKVKMIKSFERLNGFPPWAGIISQKRQLSQYLIKQAKRHNVKLSSKELVIKDKRKPVKVWSEN